jgi:hypothetical protein
VDHSICCLIRYIKLPIDFVQMIGLDTLPFELVEELKARNLFPFVDPQESTCNNLTIEIYENQKYRPVLREWGSVVGVHLFPPVDRRPYTNDNGTYALRYFTVVIEKHHCALTCLLIAAILMISRR